MHDFFEKAPDPFGDLLAPPARPADEGLRRDLLARTAGVLRNRRRRRRLGLALALAACYAAGLLTMRWVGRAADVPRPEPVVGHAGPSDPGEDPSALAREWEEVKRRRAELYREAGDLYLTAHDDPESAVRCYGEALDAGKDDDVTISLSDSWLLMAIKSARQKEKDDAKKRS